MDMFEGKKYHYMVVQELMTLDPDNNLVLEDHTFKDDTIVVKDKQTRRAVTLEIGLFTLNVEHFNNRESRFIIDTIASVDQVEAMVERIVDYISCVTVRV